MCSFNRWKGLLTLVAEGLHVPGVPIVAFLAVGDTRGEHKPWLFPLHTCLEITFIQINTTKNGTRLEAIAMRLEAIAINK